MKYLLLLCGNPQDREAWETLPDETRAQHSIRVGQWFAEHPSQIRSSNQFSKSYTATTVFSPLAVGPSFSMARSKEQE
jgi:hypothetical protein